VGWGVALWMLWYCSFGILSVQPKEDTPHTCPWGGSWTPPDYEKPDGGCHTFLTDDTSCHTSYGRHKTSEKGCDKCLGKYENTTSKDYEEFHKNGCTPKIAKDWCTDANKGDTDKHAADYGTRTHSFHDMFFSVTFRMWWAVGIAYIVWVSMAEQGGPIGALLGSSFWQPAKNLTFGVYLTHIMVVSFLYNSINTDFDVTVSIASYIFVAIYTLAVASAMVLWFLVEKPFANLMAIILGALFPRGGR